MQGFRFDTELNRVTYSSGTRVYPTRITDAETGRRLGLAFQIARGVTLFCLFLLLALGGNTGLATGLLALIVFLGIGLNAYIKHRLVDPAESGEPETHSAWLPLAFLVGSLALLAVLRTVAPEFNPQGTILVLLALGLAIPLILLMRERHGR